MKLSSKSIYAVRALVDMAYHGTGNPSKIDEISERECVPPRFLEQIFQDLKRAELVASKRGPKGGYYLTMALDEITVGRVVRAVEGATVESFCREQKQSGAGEPTSLCVTATVWKELAEKVDAVLDGVTIQDLVERGESMGVKREGLNDFMYVI